MKNSRQLFVATVCALTFSASPGYAQQAEPPETSTVIEPAGVDVWIGPLVVSRSMQMQVDAAEVGHDPGVYIGGAVRLSVELLEFDAADTSFRFDGEFGYAASKNGAVAAELNRAPVTEWTTASARATVRRPLGDALVLDVGLGVHASSFIVEPNLTYTGHRYVAAELRAGLGWAGRSSSWAFEADMSAYPVLSVNQSSGAYGESSAFGARLGAQVGYNVFQMPSTGGYAGGRLSLRYDFTRFRSQFPEERISIGGGVSEDDMHAVTLMFGYFM